MTAGVASEKAIGLSAGGRALKNGVSAKQLGITSVGTRGTKGGLGRRLARKVRDGGKCEATVAWKVVRKRGRRRGRGR